MTLTQEQIDTLTATIWEAVLQLPLEPTGDTGPADEPLAFAASVGISGAWCGTVALFATEGFAAEAARIMFSPETTTITDYCDALGELVNMIGGNMKSLLPQPCRLSIPQVAMTLQSECLFTGSRQLYQTPLQCGRHRLMIRLFQDESITAGYVAEPAA